MNPETSSALADAFLEHREAFGVSIQIEGEEVLAVVNTVDVDRTLVEGGFAEDGEVTATILRDELPVAAANGKAATYQERKYHIRSITPEVNRPTVRVVLRPLRGR